MRAFRPASARAAGMRIMAQMCIRDRVREISTQAAAGTTATSTSIAKLAALSAQLRKSVAGFRLPDYGGGTTTIGSNPASASSPRLPPVNEPANSGGAGAKIRKASGFGA